MELLLTILGWLAAIVVGFIALPFAIMFVSFGFGMAAFLVIAIFFGSLITVSTLTIFLMNGFNTVTSWFRRTAGCK
jgi:hypothetical protein